ncbi:unnamed protein product [Macrosiphum euphorbiae]|uniref:Uncharacterized protein n=1 Tax=Macrosiphum euphorbiae TaxID=13131 RepID=A0AAV0VSS3_9HEMI|nr:unnamed protein product [Macrosiphum euphorbiae]
MNVPWIIILRVVDKLVEFDEVRQKLEMQIQSKESTFRRYHRVSSASEIEHMPPITRHTEDSDCIAPDHLANNMQLLTTMDNQQPLGFDCEPDVQIKIPILSKKFKRCEKLYSNITAEDSKYFLEHLSPVSTVTEQLNAHVT